VARRDVNECNRDLSPTDRLCPLRRICAGDMFTRMADGADSDLIASITPDVMTCLRRSQFFERLDDLLCPKVGAGQRASCAGDYRIATTVLEDTGFDSTELEDIFNVLKSQGGCCDCEILYNVAESSRLKAQYWTSRVHGGDVIPKDAAQ
jgi:hypothetical protein